MNPLRFRPSLTLRRTLVAALGSIIVGLAAPLPATGLDDGAIPVEVENAVRENGCLSCHRAEGPLAERLTPVPAPNLHSSGRRYEPDYLRRFLADPHRTAEGTVMPDVLAGVPSGVPTD